MAAEVGALGKAVIITYEDCKGTGTKLARALDAPSSAWKRVVYPLDLATKLKEVNAVGQVLNFVDNTGVTQVSVISLTQQTPTSGNAHVAHVIFEFILSKAPVQDSSFTLLLPAVAALPGSIHNLLLVPNKLVLTAFINGASQSAHGVLASCPRLPVTTRIQDEFLAVLLHFVHMMALPTVLLLGPSSQGLPSSKKDTLQVTNQLGTTLAKQLGLSFSEQIAATNETDTHTVVSHLDDWRSLYT